MANISIKLNFVNKDEVKSRYTFSNGNHMFIEFNTKSVTHYINVYTQCQANKIITYKLSLM